MCLDLPGSKGGILLSWENMNNFVGSQTEYKAESIDEGRHTDRAKGRIINRVSKTCSFPRGWGAVKAWSRLG